GSLWAWGYNDNGQLGDGTTNQSTTPKLISDTGWAGAVIACGGSHTVAIKSDGSLWAWGFNIFGQLGDGTTTKRTSPKFISTGWAGAVIACGYAHTVACKADGSLWAWGYNDNGQLGDGTTNQSTTPKLISDTGWAGAVIACGTYYTIGIKADDSSLWAWGDNNYGQLGDGTTNWSITPKLISITGWSIIACGDSHTVAIKADGSIWAWGCNANGQLGDGTAWRETPVQIGQ
ncbi:MAG: hypothetical protein V1701_11075, partial [Planctomycetota bacterium]